MAVDASTVTGPTENLKTSIDDLSDSFNDSMIKLEGSNMSDVADSIKQNAETNCQEITNAAKAIANAANELNL